MAKRILSMVLCVILLTATLASCKSVDIANDTGGYITMYLTEGIYDFDPANAYQNAELTNVLSLMYATLFRLTDSGKVENYLVKSYKIVENKEADEYYMELTLKETYWSVKDQLTADDVVFAWKRLVDFRNSYDAASLLFDIKNARAIKEGDVSIDDLGVEAVEQQVVRVTFEGPTDYDRFIRNLTSVATAPLLKRYVSPNPTDWAKKTSSIATSGPFKLGKCIYEDMLDSNGKQIKVPDDNAVQKDGSVKSGNYPIKQLKYFILERNPYFDRDLKRDPVNESVTPFRLLVDCTKTDEELLADYEAGHLFYIGSIPLSLRNNETVQKNVEISDALSTFVCYLNENALIDNGKDGEYLFANAKVREALSLALDRESIAQAVVYAKAADALVPYGVFESGNSGEFRTSKNVSVKLMTTADTAKATALLNEAGITPSSYSFTIKVAAYDDVHTTIANAVKDAWNSLGFHVTVEEVQPIQNNDMLKEDDKEPTNSICDDILLEALRRGKYEVIAIDEGAFTADAYSVLSKYAYAFSGGIYADSESGVYEYETHVTGYDSVEYNILMEAIYYLPYIANIENTASDSYLRTHLDTKPYLEVASAVEHKLSATATASEKAIAADIAVLRDLLAQQESGVTVASSKLTTAYKTIVTAMKQQLESIRPLLLPLGKDLTAAKGGDSETKAAQAALANVITCIDEAMEAVDTAANAKSGNTQADLAAYYEICETAIQAYNATITEEKAAMEATKAVENSVNQITLLDAIKQVYTENAIVPTTKSSKWEAQRAELLHKAEALLMTDLPVIPVIYNQNATLTSKSLSNVKSSYYCVADFRKTKLKNWDAYYQENGDSIFVDFPTIYWDRIAE